MINQLPDLLRRIRTALPAAALIVVAAAFGGALAQGQSSPPVLDASSPAKRGPSGPPYLEPLSAGETTGVLGKQIVGPDGEKLGLITDVVVDTDGRPRAAVIDFGGFLGVGSRKVAVDWNLLSFDTQKRDRAAILSLNSREIHAAPEFRADAAAAQMVGPPLIGPSSGSDVGE